MYKVFPDIRAYIDLATEFQNNANMTGVLRLYSDMMFKVGSQNYGRGLYAAKLESLRGDVCAFEHKHVNMFSHVRKSGLFLLKFHFLDHMIENMSRFENFSVFDVLPFEQFKICIKSAYRQSFKQRATSMDEMVFSLAQMQSN